MNIEYQSQWVLRRI